MSKEVHDKFDVRKKAAGGPFCDLPGIKEAGTVDISPGKLTLQYQSDPTSNLHVCCICAIVLGGPRNEAGRFEAAPCWRRLDAEGIVRLEGGEQTRFPVPSPLLPACPLSPSKAQLCRRAGAAQVGYARGH
jgi:hypothetical protein